MSDIVKTFTSSPSAIVTTDGELCNLQEELEIWKNDVREVTELAEWNIDHQLKSDVENYLHSGNTAKSNEIGRILNVDVPEEVKNHHAVASRFVRMVRARAVNEVKSWSARSQVVDKTSTQYVSQGWKRTANSEIPSDLKPKMSLSMASAPHSFINNNPLEDGFIELHTVIGMNKRIVVFPFNRERFPHTDKVTLPDISIDEEDNIRFNFTSFESQVYLDLSTEYVVTVDVGIANYATVSVVNKNGDIVFSTTLSQRVHSLCNKVNNAEVQVASLQRQGKKYEAGFHRRANSRRKRELAIVAAQEIAEIAYIWNNAVVVVEDLGFVSNTMQHGRWNRGELCRWIEHYVNQNSSLMFKVSAHNTSKVCHKCQEKLVFKGWHVAVCENPDCPMNGVEQDRDVNATGNLGVIFWKKATLKKTVATRKRSKKHAGGARPQRTPKTRNSLKYHGRDRTKSAPTPKRKKQINKEVKLIKCSVGEQTTHYPSVATDNGVKHTSIVTAWQHKTIDVTCPEKDRICQ